VRRDMLRELVDDVAGPRRIDGQWCQTGANQRFPVVHHIPTHSTH
jgi:hypothetical protein